MIHDTESMLNQNEEMDFENTAKVTECRSNEQLSNTEEEKSNQNEQTLAMDNHTDPVPEQVPANTQNSKVG